MYFAMNIVQSNKYSVQIYRNVKITHLIIDLFAITLQYFDIYKLSTIL